MKNKTYDLLKNIALIMPLFVVLYEAIGRIWNIPYTEQITLTLTAVNAFLGGLVKKASSNYNKALDHQEYEDAGDDEDVD